MSQLGNAKVVGLVMTTMIGYSSLISDFALFFLVYMLCYTYNYKICMSDIHQHAHMCVYMSIVCQWHNVKTFYFQNGEVCISILHPPVDDPQSGELPSERWNPTQTVRQFLYVVFFLCCFLMMFYCLYSQHMHLILQLFFYCTVKLISH